MRKISFAQISIALVNKIFNWRFRIAGWTKKSKIAKKIINKMLFEKDEIIVIPNTISVNKKIEAENSEFLPSAILAKNLQDKNTFNIRPIIGYAIVSEEEKEYEISEDELKMLIKEFS